MSVLEATNQRIAAKEVASTERASNEAAMRRTAQNKLQLAEEKLRRLAEKT